MKITALVGKVDMNGYCGRDPHPEPSMEGMWLPVVKTAIENLGGVSLDDPPYDDYILTVRVPASVLTEMSGDARTVPGPDGKPYLDVELLPHELRDVRIAWEDSPVNRIHIKTSPTLRCAECDSKLMEVRRNPEDLAHDLRCPRCDHETLRHQ